MMNEQTDQWNSTENPEIYPYMPKNQIGITNGFNLRNDIRRSENAEKCCTLKL